MMMVFKRKEVLVSALVLLIGAAAVLNYNYEKKDGDTAIQTVSNSADYSVAALDEENDAESENNETQHMMGEATQVSADAKQQTDYFAQAKLNRENARSKKIELLNQVIASENSDEKTKTDAQSDLIKTANESDAEAVCENLIIAKGFESAVVFINGDEATVTVKSENFSDGDALKIQEIIASNSEIQTKNIKIVAV